MAVYFYKAGVRTEVNARLGLGLAADGIDTELEIIMREISSRIGGMLEKSGTVTIAAAANNGTLPTDFVALGNGSLCDDSAPLDEKTSLRELLNFTNTGESTTISAFCIFNKTAYVYGSPAASTSLDIYYEYEDSDVDTITMPDCAFEACIEGVCYLIELGKGVIGELPEGALTHLTLYEKQITMLQDRYATRGNEK